MDKRIVKNNKKKDKLNKSKISKENKFINFVIANKNILLVLVLLVVDIILIIFFAKDNYANYANVNGESIFVGKTRNLIFGRNYIGLIVTLFIYFYGLLVSKVLLKNKINIKWLIGWFIILFIFNILLFSGFTNKIY